MYKYPYVTFFRRFLLHYARRVILSPGCMPACYLDFGGFLSSIGVANF